MPKTNGAPAPGRGIRGRVVPGAPPPGWAPPEAEANKPAKKKAKKPDGAEGDDAEPMSPEARRAKARAAGNQPKAVEGVSRKAALAASSDRPSEKGTPPPALDLNGAKALPVDLTTSEGTPGIPPTPGTAAGEGLDPVQKKIRNLNKKVGSVVFVSFEDRIDKGVIFLS